MLAPHQSSGGSPRRRKLNALNPQAGTPAATGFRAACLLGALVLGGCVTHLPDRSVVARQDGATPADRRVVPVDERNRVLVDYRAASTALRAGDYDEAKARLDDAILRIGGIITSDADAVRARSLFAAESTKRFLGEPYERAMAYFYRGLIYWRDGEPDNARACFRSGQVIDSNPETKPFDRVGADYVLFDYLDGLASAKLGGDGSDAWVRAQANAGEKRALAPYDRAANVLVFAEYGYGPRKYAAGEYGEQLRFYVDDSPTRGARLVLDGGRQAVALPSYDDLGFQAVTRGGRVMDHILGNKAVFKSSAGTVGDVALAGSVIAYEESRRRDRRGKNDNAAEAAAVGLGVLGVIGKIASAATQPQADLRQWDNLPQHLSFAALRLAPGEHVGRLEFLDRDGQVLERRTQTVTLSVAPDDRDTVVFLSELKP